MLVGQEDDRHVLALLDVQDGAALFVEQEGGDFDRKLSHDALRAFLHRFFFDDTQDGQGKGFHAANTSLAAAARTDELARLAEGGT
jgi:hypothetical protein